jgi:hypothetical protein
MDYNTKREKLIMPEYGRGVQQMVEHCKTIADREERMRCAKTIIQAMANMAEQTTDREDFQKKLWNHLAALSQYELDIDYPVEITRPEVMNARPEPVHYPMQKIRMRQYGHLTEELLRHISEMPDSPERSELTSMVANFMKRSLYNWNRDAMDERKVRADLERYTDGTVTLDPDFHFASVSNGHMPDRPTGSKKKKKN